MDRNHEFGEAPMQQNNTYPRNYVAESSMNTPQGMPGANVPPQYAGYEQPYVQSVQTNYSGNTHGSWTRPYPADQAYQQTAPQNYVPPVRQDWSRPYPAQQTSQDWSQPYYAPQQMWQNNNGYAPQPEQAESKKKFSFGGSGNGDWKRTLISAAAMIAVVIVVVLLISKGQNDREEEAVNNAVRAYENLFCEGVYVDDINLGGLTYEEAWNKVNSKAQERMDAWSVRLTYNGQTVKEITAAELGMTVDVNAALDEAWAQGHSSKDDAYERKAAMDALLIKPYEAYTVQPSGDTSRIDRILEQLAAPVYRPAQDAYLKSYNPEAHINPFEIVPEVYGSVLHTEQIKEQLYGMVDEMESGTIELQPQILLPNVTESDIRRTLTLRGTATTEISSRSTENRDKNIQRAFQLINGTVLKPGETFSFNGVVGERSQKTGFYLATEYAYGNEREGYGGGVCQASTTIYLAAVRANMQITKREPHSDKVNYTGYGLDATVNYDGKKIDFAFKNNTTSNIYIFSYMERVGNKWNCRVDIYGEAHEEGVTYDLIAETVEILPPPEDPEYIEDKTGTKVYYIDETPVQLRAATEGYVVDSYKVTYVNGQEVSREFVARDTYKAKSQQLYVGIHDRE